jgi:S-adenosylmethionine hydrolase
MSLITLTTDFGTSDWFAGCLHGVIDRLAPSTKVIDLSHDISPGDIRGGAMTLACALPTFRDNAIHVAVVDPGVGSDRKPLAIKTAHSILIGPDNGLLSWALRLEKDCEIRVIENTAWCRHPISQTFHGRDVFAPVAAHLSLGASLKQVGPVTSEMVTLPWPEPREEDGCLHGEVIHVDRFGNAITNLPTSRLPSPTESLRVRCGSTLLSYAPCYHAVSPGDSLAIGGSTGCVELSVNGGDFARRHRVSVGTPVTLSHASASA